MAEADQILNIDKESREFVETLEACLPSLQAELDSQQIRKRRLCVGYMWQEYGHVPLQASDYEKGNEALMN